MKPRAYWDREMTPSEVGRLPREITVLRATTFLTRKVELLEAMGGDFQLFLNHLDARFPWKPASLRRWRIDTLGIRTWGAPSVEQHPDRQKLMSRYREAIEALEPMKAIAEKYKNHRDPLNASLNAFAKEQQIVNHYEAVIQAQKIEIENLRRQITQMVQALRLANKKAGETPIVTR